MHTLWNLAIIFWAQFPRSWATVSLDAESINAKPKVSQYILSRPVQMYVVFVLSV